MPDNIMSFFLLEYLIYSSIRFIFNWSLKLIKLYDNLKPMGN